MSIDKERDRIRAIKEAGEHLAEAAAEVKAVADQLQADVTDLTSRVDTIESDGKVTAADLVSNDKRIAGEQTKQDDRLTVLEPDELA
jgi:outer membrane murein-binding lipoprotein Lpp